MLKDDGWVLDMLLAARKVREFGAGTTFEEFSTDDLRQNAIMHPIQIIGETARNVSGDYRTAYPEIPWSQIVAMRNRLVHHYFKVVPERIWEVVERDIGPLIAMLERVVPPPEPPT